MEGMQESLDPERGPVIRVVMFDGGKGEGKRIGIVVHHLSVDGVSWRILLEDLGRAYEQVREGKGVELGAKSSSYREWAEALERYVEREEVREEVEYWGGEREKETGRVPVDEEGGENIAGESGSVEVWLSEEETERLLVEVPRVYRSRIDEVLLTAMVGVWEEWSGSGRLRIDVEGHGREEIGEEVDVTRTVGWFTSVYPVVLERAGGGIEEELKRVKEELRRIPRRGVGYGVLKYMSREEEVRERLRGGEEAEISFNYLGQFDEMLEKKSEIRVVGEKVGRGQSRRQKRKYVLEVNGAVGGGRLQMSWRYSERLHRRETIERVAKRYIERLRELIEESGREGARAYVATDFPLSGLKQEELEEVVGGGSREIEDIYTLSPMQEGMLFHSLYSPESGAYVIQMRAGIDGRSSGRRE